MKRISILLLASLLVLALTACNMEGPAATTEPEEPAAQAPSTDGEEPDEGGDAPADSGEAILIGGSIMTLQYPWFLGAEVGMRQWAEEHPDANVTFQFEDSQSDIQTCITNLENMAAAGAKGIVIFPVDSKAIISTMVDLNRNNGIYFVVGDYPQEPDSDEDIAWETFVGHNMLALGQIAGQVAVEYLETLGKDDPTLLFITTPTSGEVTRQRFQGFSDVVLAAFPNANILEEGDTGGGDRNSAQTLMENILQREAVIDVVAGHNDAEVLGAYNAAVGAGRAGEMKFVGIAGDKEVLGYIADDEEDAWIGEVLQDPVVLGYTAMDALWKAMNGESLPDQYDLPMPEAITPANISEYDWENWSWLG